MSDAPVPYNYQWPVGYVCCHGDGHGSRARGDETFKNTPMHRREDTRLIRWPDGGGLWHCPKHADHEVRGGRCEPAVRR